MSTNGELLSEPEFLALLAARKKEKKDELAKKAANQAARTERAEQRIIDANETENLPCINLSSPKIIRVPLTVTSS